MIEYSLLTISLLCVYLFYSNHQKAQKLKKATREHTTQIHKTLRENSILKDNLEDIKFRNERLVRLYHNLQDFESEQSDKARVLAEATQIMDVKNREIKRARDVLMEQGKELTEVHEELKNSIKYALNIQEAIIPDIDTIVSQFKDAFIFYQPKDIVSGDFYWFANMGNLEKEVKVLIAADCTGHGVPGAFMTMLASSLINEIVLNDRITEPNKILLALDKKLTNTFKSKKKGSGINDGLDIAILTIDEKHKFIFFAAAHQPLYYVRKNKIYEIKGSKFPVGSTQYGPEKDFKLNAIQYEDGDVFYIFSDGFQDQFGEKEKRKFMSRRFRELILSVNRLPLKLQLEKISKEFQSWKGKAPQTDDVTVIGIRV